MKKKISYASYPDLVSKAMKQNADAFLDLYHCTYADQFSLAFSLLKDYHLAEDAVQEAYLNAWRDLPKLKEPEKFVPWLSTITHRMAVKLMQKNIRQDRAVEAVSEDMTSDTIPDLSELMEQRELSNQVVKALEQLSPKQQSALKGRYFSFLTNREIAQQMGCTEYDVKYYLRSGRQKLAVKLKHLTRDSGLRSWVLVPFIPETAEKLPNIPQNAEPVSRSHSRRIRCAIGALSVVCITGAAIGIGMNHETLLAAAGLTEDEASTVDSSSVDTEPPYITAYHCRNNALTLKAADDGSGLDSDSVYATLPDGTRLNPESTAEEDGQMTFHATFPMRIYLTDKEGNETFYDLSDNAEPTNPKTQP